MDVFRAARRSVFASIRRREVVVMRAMASIAAPTGVLRGQQPAGCLRVCRSGTARAAHNGCGL